MEFVRTGSVREAGAALRRAADLDVPEESFWNKKRPAMAISVLESDGPSCRSLNGVICYILICHSREFQHVKKCHLKYWDRDETG